MIDLDRIDSESGSVDRAVFRAQTFRAAIPRGQLKRVSGKFRRLVLIVVIVAGINFNGIVVAAATARWKNTFPMNHQIFVVYRGKANSRQQRSSNYLRESARG